MSVISNRHTLVPFVSGETKAMDGQNLARILYKPSKNGKQKFPSMAVSVPKFSDDEIYLHMDALKDHIRNLIESSQEGLIKNLYEQSEGKIQSVAEDEISIKAIISFLDAESTGERLKKEQIEKWFDSQVSDNLFVLIAEKLGFADGTPNDAQTATIQKHVKIYRDVLSMLAGGATILAKDQIKGCRVAISLASDDDSLGQKLTKRLDTMEKPAQVVAMLDLG